MKKLITLIIISITLPTAPLYGANSFEPKRVPHAGGGINGKTYTNSYDALDLSIKRGFSYFEIDFSFTSDDRLVCLHDWEGSFERSFGFKTDVRLTLEEFRELAKEKSEFQKCTLEGLIEWMEGNS